MTKTTLLAAGPPDAEAAKADAAAGDPVKAADAAVKSVVLVHGAFVDGSGWLDVHKILEEDGHEVSVVQNPLTSPADDVAATRRAIAEADGGVILVGHSYGGVVSQAGTAPKVAGVVHIAAFAPDEGESVASLTAEAAPGAPAPPILPPRTAVSSSIAPSSPGRSRPMSVRTSRRSWRFRNCRGAPARSRARSPTRRGARGRAGTWSRLTIG